MSNISSTENDVNIHIGKAWTVIDRLSTEWKSDLFDEIKREFLQAVTTSVLRYGCTIWTLANRLDKKVDGNYTIIFWTNPGSNTLQNNKGTATYLLSHKPSK